MTQKILFDTDIGTDIDDALALTYLLTEPRCQLLGVTTVSGEASLRAEMVSTICHHSLSPPQSSHPAQPSRLSASL